jgi:hypothetical protein
MTTTAGQGRACGDPQRYEIRLQGHLDPRWADRLGGLALALEGDGTTTLTGSLPDQAALHGLLAQIRDLGVSIVSIKRLSAEEEVGNS